MTTSSSSSCKSLTSKPQTAGEVCSTHEAELCACDTYGHALQGNIAPESTQPVHRRKGGTVTGECDARNSAPSRKAERERLRRDRLNEQLLELAGALEPDRPKNDKSTILGDAIQALKDLMTDVQRLRAEHTSLAEESQDLSQEKKELQDEKLQLMSKVERLQSQIYRQMHEMLMWMTADPVGMMNAGSIPYPGTSLPHGTTDVAAHSRPPLVPGHSFVRQPQTNSYVSVPLGTGVHPGFQTHYGYGGGGAPYFPYPFTFSNGPSQPEVPSTQVPRSASGYPLDVHQSTSLHPMQSILQTAPYPQAYGPGFATILPSIKENHYAVDAGTTMGVTVPSSRQTVPDPVSSPLKACNSEQNASTPRHVQTALQLRTPASLSIAQLPQSQQGFRDHRSSEARSKIS